MRTTPTAQQEARTELSDFGTGLTGPQGNQQAGQTPSNLSFLGPQLGLRSGSELAAGQRPQPGQFESGGFGGDGSGSPGAPTPLHKKLADMTDLERYGLPGLLSMIPLESPDYSSLAMGQDLTVLGLDLSRPE
jgi:CCR4-NOT transcription complex subunit 2